MLDYLHHLSGYLPILNVTRYITFRTAAASLTALAIGLFLGPIMIRKLREFQIGQVIRQEGPATHRKKAGTPTMGGLLILASALIPTLLWADLRNHFVWLAVLATAAFGSIGFADDYLKIVRKSHHGLRPRYKMGWQAAVGIGVGIALLVLNSYDLYSTRLIFPFFKRFIPDIGWFYVPFAAVVLVGATNMVNLTDGLDGLAISVFSVAAAAFTAVAYVSTHREFANYLQLVRIEPAAAELTIFCGALVGASLGFLWWNSYPADIFMGDVGSLGLGGALGLVALLVKQEFLLVFVGGVFVIEALSVIIQVASFKMTGKRVFRMAPIDHHFELAGWAESKVIWRFLIVAIVFALFGLTTLKLAMTPPPFSVFGKRVVVAGAARSGIAAAQLLVRRGATVTLSDVRASLPESRELEAGGITLELGGHGLQTFANADLIVMSPGVPARQPVIEAARAAGATVIGELELASRWLAGRIVAITGTKGKSTTTTLTGRMLSAGGFEVLVGGNIGHALSAQVDQSTASTIHVIEASSFQLEGIDTFHPWIAVLLNFSPDHLDRHASVEEYAAAKRRIFENQIASDWVVLNADDPASLDLARTVPAQRRLVSMSDGLAEGICIENGSIVRRARGQSVALVPLTAVRLLGRHLLADVLAAAAIADLAGVTPAAMTAAVEGFTGLEHALEPVAQIGGVQFVNDSKATNIEAARRAIESFGEGLVVILGGRFKGGEFGDLAGPLTSRGAAVIAIGESRDLIARALGSRVSVQEAADMSGAVRQAFALAAPGGTVLLAPACASFDMFRDYAERGRVFKQETRKLEEEWNGMREQ